MATGDCAVLAWDHWHIEPSSICTLKCPRCPRAEVPDSLLNRQLTLDFFKTQIGEDTARRMRKITFCGNDGDSIYCRELVDIIVWFKTLNPRIAITIITNGSYRAPGWWQYLGKVLDANDEVHWSLDGWDQASNEQYRINSEWSSIEQGIRAFAQVNERTYRVWAAIAFKFNQNYIEHQKDLATQWGFDLYQLTKSTKFGSKYPAAYPSKDPLEPTVPTLVASGHRFQRDSVFLSDKNRPGDDLRQIFWQRAQSLSTANTHSGICLIGNKGAFLNSQGEFYPCCWTANRYPHNQQWHDLARERFNLWQRPFQDVIQDPFWQQQFLDFDSFECRTKCTRDKLADREHTVEW